MKDYYKILGIPESASGEDVKRAYRKLAREHHPDRNPGNKQAEERFKEVQEANSVLSDPAKRKQYDRAKSQPFAGTNGGFRRAPDGGYTHFETGSVEDLFGGGASEGGLGDFFSRMFSASEPAGAPGPRTRRRSPARGDVSTTLRLSFDQALEGGKTEVRLPDGKAVRLNVPRGVDTGFKIRLTGRGEPTGRGAARGDLYVTFEVEPHPIFRRSGNDLYVEVDINPFEALLGTSRSVANAYGTRVKVTIPEGTQHGDRLRLKGLGVQTEKATGDLYVVTSVKIPKDLSSDQKDELRKVARKTGLLK